LSTVREKALPFEKRLRELEAAIAKAATDEERARLEAELLNEAKYALENLTPWERVEFARHGQRPRMLDFTACLLEDFIELHGDRASGDDPAMVGGIGRFRGETVVVIGQQKGVSTEEKVRRNWGMPHPEGYRKALRLYKLAERLHVPVLTFVDTPAAHPGIEAEERGQGFAISQNLLELAGLKVPIFSVILSEGGSGGALAIAVADHIAMFQHAVYMICPPERCAEILWRDVNKKDQAAAALKVTAKDLLALGVIDEILPEPEGGAQRDGAAAGAILAEAVARFLERCRAGGWSPELRQEKFARMGAWLEGEPEAPANDDAPSA
jgi:acetyl-CoA carboxylase carboxyl transferase subunit alpha